MINVYKLIVYISLSLIYHLHAQSLQEIQKMKTEYDKFKREGNIQLNSNNASLSNPDMLIPRPNEVQILPYSEEFKEDEKTKHFGYDFFTRRDSITFWENLPTPSNYLLGPGDELIITLWGETQLRQSYIISKEGNIYDEKVGLLNLNGRSISDARNYLNNQFSRLYATLITNPPSSFIDISLGNLQSINVNFVGEVKYPGLYLLHPYSNIVNGLIHAGGIDTTGSLRHIEIKRDDGLIESIDLYDYFINGLSSSSIQLRNQDIIFIPPRKSYIEIDSAVVRPGIYESKEKDNIYDMIRYAGGLKYNASGKIGIKSINNSNKKDITSRVKSFYVNYENTKLIPTSTGDKITPLYSFDEIQQVEIIGQVKSPGVYHYSPEMTLQDLLELASGCLLYTSPSPRD